MMRMMKMTMMMDGSDCDDGSAAAGDADFDEDIDGDRDGGADDGDGDERVAMLMTSHDVYYDNCDVCDDVVITLKIAV